MVEPRPLDLETLEHAVAAALETVLRDGGLEQPYGVIAERVAAHVADAMAHSDTAP